MYILYINYTNQVLGEGCFGKVFNIDGVAVKYFRRSKELPVDVIREYNTLTILKDSEGVVGLLNINLEILNYRISLRLYDTNLANYIISTEVETRAININKILSQLLSAIISLEKHNLSHNDIKPDNILLKKEEGELSCCLCDFGCCSDSRVCIEYLDDRNNLGYVILCYLSSSNIVDIGVYSLRKLSGQFNFSNELNRCDTATSTTILELVNYYKEQEIIDLPTIDYPPLFRDIVVKTALFHDMVYINAYIMYNKLEIQDIYSAICCIYISMSLIEDIEVASDLDDILLEVKEPVDKHKLHIMLIEVFQKVGKIWIY